MPSKGLPNQMRRLIIDLSSINHQRFVLSIPNRTRFGVFSFECTEEILTKLSRQQSRERGGNPAVVSSSHLAQGKNPSLSELEYGLIVASHAFSRWIVRCMIAAGQSNLSPLEVLILHTVRNRETKKTLADICLVLDIADTHIANYAINKLKRAGLVSVGKSGKEKSMAITQEGLDLCDRYGALREELLLSAISNSETDDEKYSTCAALLRSLSGMYDQAARAAATLR